MKPIVVYGASWCPDCRRTKRFLDGHKIPYEWHDIDEDDQALRIVQEIQDGGRTIPTVVIDDGLGPLFEPTDEELASRLGLLVHTKKTRYDLAIIGGGPAGIAASIYGAREGVDTVLIEASSFGGNASVTERVDNYPGFPDGVAGGDLIDRFVAQAKRYEIEMLAATKVVSVQADAPYHRLTLSNGDTLEAAAVLVATGSSYRRLNVDGENELLGKSVHYCATCDGPFYRGSKELMVIGGGNSALEESMFLNAFTEHIRIVQLADHLTASPILVEKVLNSSKYDVHLSSEVVEFEGSEKLSAVKVKNLKTGEINVYHPEGVFVFIGLTPNTAIFDGLLTMDEGGFIVTDRCLSTNIEGIFAAGDVRSGSTKQLASASGEAVAALLQIRNYLARRN